MDCRSPHPPRFCEPPSGSLMPKEKHPWFRRRGYLHFDTPVGLSSAESLVTNEDAVAKHSFYPLISYEVTSKKVYYCKDEEKLKRKDKPRPICYAAHLDSHIYSYYTSQMSKQYENLIAEMEIAKSILAFRLLGKSNIDFAAEAFNCIREKGDCGVVGLDISGFFNGLDHGYLKKAWCNLLGVKRLPADHFAIFKSLTKYAEVNREKLYSTLGLNPDNRKNKQKNIFRVCSPKDFREKIRGGGLVKPNTDGEGIPQGTSISAFLSNVYMIEFDRLMCVEIETIGGTYLRYCDDMLFIVPIENRDKIAELVVQNIKKIHLKINTYKTEIRTFKVDANGILSSDKPLQYLGFTFDGQRILLRSASLARYSDRMKRGVRFAKTNMRKRNQLRAKKGQDLQALYKKKLFSRYSHLGQRNFLTYGYRAAETMGSKAIRKQLKPLWGRLLQEIER